MYVCLSGGRSGCGIDRFPNAAFQKELIVTFFITAILEGVIVAGYCIWCRKSLGPILFTSVWANLITQSFLWIVLSLFFQHYIITLFIAEFFIWMIESFLLYRFSANQLRIQEAALVSLLMNLASFGLGWFLPT